MSTSKTGVVAHDNAVNVARSQSQRPATRRRRVRPRCTIRGRWLAPTNRRSATPAGSISILGPGGRA